MRNKTAKVLFNLLIITIFFNVWFPKAGIKLAGIPLTVGNVFLGLTFVLWFLLKIRDRKIKITKLGFIIISGTFYFILKYILIVSKFSNIAAYMTYIIPLIIYPLMFFLTADIIDSKEKADKVFKVIYYGFMFLCFYSLLQFFFGIEKTAIPGLTVNLTDYRTMGSQWFLQKSNGVDVSSAKIVSTYQNGNLLGINLLLLYPIIYLALKKKDKGFEVMFSLILFIGCTFLTLSRTAWLGIVLFIFFGILFERDRTKKSFLVRFLLIILCIICIIFVFNFMPSVANRFLDTSPSDWISMSGRTEGLIKVIDSVSKSNSFLAWIIGPTGIINFSGLAYEMLPLSLFAQTGFI